MTTPSESLALDWEDADPAAARWWISRAREKSASGPRDFFIAEDDMTEAIIGLMRVPPQSHYTVLAATFLDRFESRAAAAASLKADVSAAFGNSVRTASVRRALLRWRVVRLATILRLHFPFLLLGLCGGVLLGLAIAFFAVWTGLVGWPIVAAGIVLGGLVGVLFNVAVQAFRARATAGPWGRFAIIMLGAVVAAGATATVVLMKFWH